MGGGSGAKKKKRGGKKNKSRGPSSKDHHHHHNDSLDDNDILSEELTVLGATYQDDFKIISESPLQYTINLRPYSKDTGYEDLDASAILSVRCLPGYPYKCPKLKLTPGESLTSNNADKLLSLLHQQANFAAREGRAMVFNLVEAAKEFLSEIIPVEQPNDPVSCSGTGQADQWISGDVGTTFDRAHSSRGPYVYGLVDLFTGSGESWDWGSVTDKNSGRNSNTLDHPNIGYQSRKEHGAHNEKPVAIQDTGRVQVPQLIGKLDPLKEESGSDSNESSRSLAEESSENEHMDQKVSILQDMTSDDDGSDVDNTPPDLLLSILPQDRASESFKKDLIMVHLLHLACSAKGPLAEALPEITSELHKLGIFPGWVRDLATKPPSVFSEAFNHVFREHMVISPHSQFWNGTSDYGAQTTSLPNSRYLNDFEELSSLGHGGFGHVALCKNKLDGRQYAMKKIRLKDKSPQVNDKILREVATLSRLQHQHVVRYYQAWFETEAGGGYNDMVSESRTASYSSYSYMGPSSTTSVTGPDNKLESTYLYIQMELCPRTLRQVFESYGSLFGKELAWHLFRQIVEGLAHIHAQGIIHRDLTPNNIFFDARNDIKIGDFGLAKFLKLEQLDLEPSFPAETGVSMDGTGQVGTYFYTAPEIEQGWPKIDEKVDMYSLGVVFFELWHPFETAMERHIVLSDLKQKGSLPPSWVADYPEQASILRRLMSPSPSDRPSATELLQSALPPRMEDEWLNDILRTIQSPEDTRVYDRVVQTIFDEQRLISKSLRQHGEKVNSYRGDSSFVQYTESETEFHDHVIEVAKEVFRQHNAKRLEITPMRLLDDYFQFNRRNTVKLLTHEGDMLELCHEMRLPFAYWVTTNQKLSFKRYEISWVYRRAIGHSTPNRYLQGDFDIVGGTSPITEALITKVAIDLITRFFNLDRCHIRLNHADLLDAIWSWVGIKTELRESVAQRLSVMSSLRPQSSQRKSSWVFIRRQLLQDLNLPEVVVNRLQTVDLRFCGVADQAVPRLMGALHPDKHTRKALEELSTLLGYLRVWKIEQNVFLDALMPPTESYHHGLYFQVFNEGTLLAVGGRYDHLLHQMRDPEYKTNPPSAVGVSIALETIFSSPAAENKPFRNEATIPVLICSRGGGGLLKERMELVAELWEANIKAEFVPISDPSLTEQYEYANEHDIKCLIIMTETGLSQTCSLKVRHLELKKEKEVNRDDIVKFLVDAAAAQFRNYSIWT